MAVRSLGGLHSDVISKILHFVPSIWQLFQLELTSLTFRWLTLDFMKLMTVVDMRTPFRISEQTEEQMRKLIYERFSSKLKKVICESQLFSSDLKSLMKVHPQLFPFDICKICFPAYSPDEASTSGYEFFELFWDFNCSVLPVHESLVITCPELVHIFGHNPNLEDYSELVLQDDYKHITRDAFPSVYVIHELLTRTSSAGVSTLAGLKRILLRVEQSGTALDLQMADRLKRLIVTSKVEIFLDFLVFVVSEEPVLEEVLAVIGSHISSFDCCSKGLFDSNYLLSLSNLRSLHIDYLFRDLQLGDEIPDAGEDINLSHLPATVTDLRVTCLSPNTADSLSQFLKASGQQLEILSIGYNHVMERHNVHRLLAAIADNCVNLKTFYLLDSNLNCNPVDLLSHLLEKIGSKLTELKMICYGADASLVDTVVLRCKNLKYLDLVVAEETDLDVMTSCETLKMMTKLVSARIQLSAGHKLLTRITYRNHKLACYPKTAIFV